MNIYALNGHKVKVTEDTKTSGYTHDKENVEKYLEIEKEYIVERTEVSGWSTSVYLQGIVRENGKRVSFNSCSFVDVEPQSEEDDKKHPDWSRYN